MPIRLIVARLGFAVALIAVGTSAFAQEATPPAAIPDAPAAAPAEPAPGADPQAVPQGTGDGESPQPVPPVGTTTSGASAPASAGQPVTPSPQPPSAVQPGGSAAGGAAEAPTAAPESLAPTNAGEGVGEPVLQAPFATEFPGAEAVAPEAAASAVVHDLSPWGMFMAADWVVKGVMILLAVFSLATWIIWIAKGLELRFAKRRAQNAVSRLDGAASLDSAIHEGRRPLKRGPVAALALTAAAENELSGDLPAEGVKERVAVAMQRIEARSGRRISRGTGLLATIGSTSPFIGLFGTVWGIMNSFIGIAETNTTNLAVVAPGIAEALLATGIGLVAAIPAVIIYNAFARSIAGYRAILSDGSAAVLRHLSRDLDRRDAGYRLDPRTAPAE